MAALGNGAAKNCRCIPLFRSKWRVEHAHTGFIQPCWLLHPPANGHVGTFTRLMHVGFLAGFTIVYQALDRPLFLHNYGTVEKNDALAALAALAHETRLDIFRALVQAGSKGVPAGQLGEHLGLPSATLSFHLKELRHAGLITFQRESRSLIYSAAFANMNALLAYLTENCCLGDTASCGVGLCDGTKLEKPERRKTASKL